MTRQVLTPIRKIKRRATGQSLVEYTFILVMIAITVIIGAGLIGLAVQRVYGVIGGAFNVKHNSTTVHHTIVIDSPAQCVAISTGAIQTGLWVFGETDEDVTTLTGSTDLTVGRGMDNALYPITQSNPGQFSWLVLLSTKADLSVCPKSVVIQGTDGSIATAPVIPVMK